MKYRFDIEKDDYVEVDQMEDIDIDYEIRCAEEAEAYYAEMAKSENCCKNCKHIILGGGVGMCFNEKSPYWHYERFCDESCDKYERQVIKNDT